MTEEKIRENRVRRAAERQGLRLVKSRRRDPRAYDYGTYMLVDGRTNAIVCGQPVTGQNGSASLDQIEAALRERN